MRLLSLYLSAVGGLCLIAAPAVAAPVAAPGPLIGVGLPLAGAVVATVLIVRHFRQKP